MAKYREIRGRIQGVDNTAKITQAMKMVAAAKLRRAQDSIIAARPYGRKLRELLQFLASSMETAISPLLEEREVERVCLVVVAADRGLCGAFNSNLLKLAANLIDTRYADLNRAGNLDVIAVGKRSVDYFVRRGYNVIGTYAGVFNPLEFITAQQIVNQVRSGFLDRTFDRVDVIYNEFKSVAKQDVAVMQLLPIPKLEGGAAPAMPIDYIFEPSRGDILDALLPTHLNTQMWNVLLESNAAEQGARMTAMENATRNAKDLVRELRRSYNKARQTAITTEILEIVSGAEALKSQ
jgi:F-type H+-transporting ATPase subunit gamma